MPEKKQVTRVMPAVVTGVMLSNGRINGVTYAAGCVVEGIPMDVAQAHTNVLDIGEASVLQATKSGAVVGAFIQNDG